MRWSKDADHAVQKIPFFVRKKVKKRLENHVEQKGRTCVDLADVNELKQKFLSRGGMEKEIKGYEVTTCFGGSGCPNAANSCAGLAMEIERLFEQADILCFLKDTVKGDIKFHHEFRVALCDCPNACSRPQIADIGIMGAVLPGLTEETCTLCSACAEACDEKAIVLDKEGPRMDDDLCLMCARCIRACPTATLGEKQKGFRIMLGGRLGRHPRLAMAVAGIHTHDGILKMVKKCLKFYKENAKDGQRFSHILCSVDPIVREK